MSLKAKLGDTWKEAKSLHVKVNGEWKDISKLYSKKDGAWFVVFSGGGAIIEFLDYPYAIPVMKGWEYSTDGVTWTTVKEDVYVPTLYWDFSNIEFSWGQQSNIDLRPYYLDVIPKLPGAKFLKEYGSNDVLKMYIKVTYNGAVTYHDGQESVYNIKYSANGTDDPYQGMLGAIEVLTDEDIPDGFNTGDFKNSAVVELLKIEVLDAQDGNVLQTYTPENPMPSGYLGLTGKVGDWDFSTVNMTGESAGNGNWAFYFVFPYATGPDITRLVIRAADGSSSEEISSISTMYDMAYPSKGSGIYFEAVNSALLNSPAIVEYYSGNTLLATADISFNWYGQYECEVTYPPFTGYVKVKSELGLTEYTNGTTFDWDFSKIDFTGESSGDGVNWSWFYVFPYATGPDITKAVFTYSDGTITEVSVSTEYSMAWPSEGSGIVFERPISDTSKTTVSIDYYSDDIHLATTSAPQDNGYGEYKSEVVYNPDLGVKIPVTEGSTYDINDWDVSGATYNLNGGVSHFTVSGVTGSVPTCTGIRLQHESWIAAGFEPRIIPVSGNNPNDTYIGISSPMIGTTVTILQLLDEDGNVLADFINPGIDTKIVANTSKVLTFNSPVTGTINYVAGDLTPSVQITVTDGSGNVIEGAEITILGNDWDLSNASVSTVNGATNTISGITGSSPIVTTMVIIVQEGIEKTLDVSDNNPNMIYQGSIPTSLTTLGIRLLDAEGNTVAYRSDVPRTLS